MATITRMKHEVDVIMDVPRAPKGRKSYTIDIIRNGVHYFYCSVPFDYMKDLRFNPQGKIAYIYDDQKGEFLDT